VELDVSDSTKIAIIAVHLAPFKEGAATRLSQLQQLSQSTEAPLIIIGDCNMRDFEMKSVGSLRLQDAWVMAGSPASSKHSWDSYVNLYHGDEAFKFQCRFDRCLVRHAGAVIRVDKIEREADVPLLHPNHFLSDHFALKFTLSLYESESS
jgi:endonuclease/exonuclease/phosphatase family metal-dependent hydrolase